MADMVGTSDGKTYTSDMDHYLEYSGLKQSPNERVSQTFDQVYKAIDEGTMDPQGRNSMQRPAAETAQPLRFETPFKVDDSLLTLREHKDLYGIVKAHEGLFYDDLLKTVSKMKPDMKERFNQWMDSFPLSQNIEDRRGEELAILDKAARKETKEKPLRFEDTLIPPPKNPALIDPESKAGKVLHEAATIMKEHAEATLDVLKAPGDALKGNLTDEEISHKARTMGWMMGWPITKFPIAKYPTSARLAPDNVIPINREQTSIQPWDVPLGEHANQNIPGLDQLRYPPFLPKNASEESITRVLQQMEEEYKFSLATDKPIPDPQLHMPAKTQEEIRAILEQRAKEGGYKIDKDGMIISDPYVNAQIQASWNDMIKKQKDLTDKIARERRAKFVVHEGSTEKK